MAAAPPAPGQGAPSPTGGSEGCWRLGEARAAFHRGAGTWCPDRRPCVGPVCPYKGDRAARREGVRGRAACFSPALREDGFLTRCRLYSQQINNFLSRQQCWPVCVSVGVSRCPPSRAFPPAVPSVRGGSAPLAAGSSVLVLGSFQLCVTITSSCDGCRCGSIPVTVRVPEVAGKHGGWRGGTAQLREAALGFAACLAWWNGKASRRASTRGGRRCTLPSVPACNGCWRCSRSTNLGAPGTPGAAKRLALNPTAACVTQECLHSCARSHEPVHTCSPLLGAPVRSGAHLHGRAPCVAPAPSLPSPAAPARSTDTSPLCGHTTWHPAFRRSAGNAVCSTGSAVFCSLFISPGVVPQVGDCSS